MTTDQSTTIIGDLVNVTNPRDKLALYDCIKDYLNKNVVLNTKDQRVLIENLKRDIVEKDITLKCSILDISYLLIRSDKDVIDKLEISNFLKGLNDENSDFIREKVQKILLLITSNCFLEEDFSDMLSINRAYKIDMEIITKTCTNFSQKKSAAILIKLIPNLFKQTHEIDRTHLFCDIALMLLKNSDVAREVINSNQDDITENILGYIAYTDNLRKQKNNLWCKQLIILIRLIFVSTLSKRLHLVNGVLRLLQDVFQNGTLSDKLKAYDCWSELIESYSLNVDSLLYEEKTMKLLMKPLKTRLCKSHEILVKRFHVWTKLLQHLDHKSEECLEKYLKFCFMSLKNVESNNEFAKNLAFPNELWPKSTEVLINIFGHQCDPSNVCLNKEALIFQNRTITNDFFQKHYQLVIDSTVECCKNLTFWVEESLTRKQILKCLSKSLFHKVNNVEGELRQTILKKLSESVKSVAEIVENHSDDNLKDFIQLIFKYKWESLKEIFNVIFIPILVMILERTYKNSDNESNFFLDLLNNYSTTINFNAFYESVINLFDKQYRNVNASMYLWKISAKLLLDICTCGDKIYDTIKLIVWLLENYNMKFDKNNEIVLQWEMLTKYYFNNFPKEINTVIRRLIDISKSKPIYSMSFIKLFSMLIKYIIEVKDSPEGINILKILTDILSLPAIIKPDVLLPLLDFVIDLNLPNEEIKSNILLCVERFIYPHKEYGVLTILSKYLTKHPNLKSNLTPSLMLQLNEINVNSIKNKLTVSFLNSLKSKKDEKVTPKVDSPIFNNEYSSPRTDGIFNFFGNRSVTGNTTPRSTKSAKINKPTVRRRGRPRVSLPLAINRPEDDDSAKFVFIDEEYKFQPKKLSKQQKEKLTKPRDDIPALYQDLSQSKSNLYDNSSNSNFTQSSLLNTNSNTTKIFNNDAQSNNSPKKHETRSLTGLKNEDCIKNQNVNSDELKVVKKIQNIKRKNDKSHVVSKKCVQREMKKIKMNIVGVEDFIKSTKMRAKPPTNFTRKLRSRRNGEETNKSAVISENAGHKPKRGRRKRKYDCLINENSISVDDSIVLKNSQEEVDNLSNSIDVVENSQEPSEHIKKMFHSKTNESTIAQKIIKETEKETSVDENVKDTLQTKEVSISEMDTVSQISNTTQEDEVIEINKETVLEDKSRRPIDQMNDTSICEMSTLTLSNKDISLADMDTQSVNEHNMNFEVTIHNDCVVKLEALSDECIAKLTPPKSKHVGSKVLNLPGSPILDDTPVRLSNLLNETNDLSPIRVDNEVKVSSPQQTTRVTEDTTRVSEETPKIKTKLRHIKKPNARLEMLQNLKPNVKKLEITSKPYDTLHTSSPRSDRIKKIISKCETKSKKSPENVKEKTDLLAFVEIPNIVTTPRTSILKRKMPDTPNDGFSPSSKKKRVNFSDPPTTSEKIYEAECNDSDSTNSIDMRLNQIFDTVAVSCDVKEDVPPQDKPIDSNLIDDKTCDKNEEYIPPHDKPIYPNLIDDKTGVNKLLEHIFLKRHISKNVTALNNLNIKTVGDLARLNHVNVVRLPVICSKAVSVRNALKIYENDKCKKETKSKFHLQLIDGIEPLDNDDNMSDKELQINEILRIIKSRSDLDVEGIANMLSDNKPTKELSNFIKATKDFLTS